MNNKITVRNLQGDTYQVIELYWSELGWEDSTVLYQGSLADCEAYIKLKEGGYM